MHPGVVGDAPQAATGLMSRRPDLGDVAVVAMQLLRLLVWRHNRPGMRSGESSANPRHATPNNVPVTAPVALLCSGNSW